METVGGWISHNVGYGVTGDGQNKISIIMLVHDILFEHAAWIVGGIVLQYNMHWHCRAEILSNVINNI